MEPTTEDTILLDGFSVLGDAMDSSVLVTDRRGGVRFANRRARALLGWERSGDLSSRSLESIPIAESLRTRLRRDPGPWETETTFEAPGRPMPVHLSAQPIAHRGRAVGSLVLISEVADATTLVAERDRARQSDRAKTRSLHMVAHDLSGPLTIVNGYISLVLDGSIGVEQLEPHIPVLADQLEHMQRLVQVLLDTARLEEGRLELQLEPLDLVTFVEDIVSRMRPPETGHHLVVRRLAQELPVLGDPSRLDSIVRNIVSNAIKYSPEGTVVTCTLERVEGSPTLEVADQGSGIERDDLDRLFKRFGRVGDLTTNPAGVGLGLFLSRELARLHGGDLDATSEVGKGSRFRLRLPLRDVGVR